MSCGLSCDKSDTDPTPIRNPSDAHPTPIRRPSNAHLTLSRLQTHLGPFLTSLPGIIAVLGLFAVVLAVGIWGATQIKEDSDYRPHPKPEFTPESKRQPKPKPKPNSITLTPSCFIWLTWLLHYCPPSNHQIQTAVAT